MNSAALQAIPGGHEPTPDAEAEFVFDTWHADRLGIVRRRSPTKIHFAPISQLWLREKVKRWAKFRPGTGASFGTLCSEAQAMGWFLSVPRRAASRGGRRRRADPSAAGALPVMAGVLGLGREHPAHLQYLGFLHNFLESCRRHSWLAGLPADANIYFDELLRRPRPAPRFIDEFVMAQLEDPTKLATLPDATTRHLVVLLIETGLRSSDALNLPFSPMLNDSAGWPCLRYYNAKIAEDQLIPLSPFAAETIRAQQAHLRDRSPDRDPVWLFPRPRGDPAEAGPFSYHTFRTRFTAWQQAIGLRDEAGAPVHVTAHQFRHTVGTRMINDGVPQHVIQRLLGHTTAQMTARYAHIHDTTLREAFDDYQRRRVDIRGQRLAYDPIATTADAEWIKHNLARIAASLPNGYCGRPPQQDCPHPNACLTCPDFQTTPEFLPLHRRQRDDTLVLLTAAEQAGKTRLADTHRQVASNIGHIIDALEAIEQEPTLDDS